jgi:phosphopantetheine adenylyltransferase
MRFYGMGLSVLDMSAVTFLALLNEMYKLRAEEGLEKINITSIPYMQKNDASDVINSYKSILAEVPEDYTDYGNIDKLREKL